MEIQGNNLKFYTAGAILYLYMYVYNQKLQR